MRWQKWTEAEIKELKRLVQKDDLFYTEIAQLLKRKAAEVSRKSRELGLKAPAQHRKGRWNEKHAHLREAVFRYYLRRSFQECQKKFKLTKSELKSIFTVGYRMDALAHLRKDTRRHDEWTLGEWLFMIRHCGIRERRWIALKLKRGNDSGRVIKERLKKHGGGSTRYLNGMPRTWAAVFWPSDLVPDGIKTKAGAHGPGKICQTVLIPWVECERLSKAFVTDPTVRACIRAMATFQRFIYRTPNAKLIRKRIKSSLKGGDHEPRNCKKV